MTILRRKLSPLLVAVFVVAAAVLWMPAAADAQDEVVIDQLTVRIWPEFDRPSALVFYVAQLSDGTSLPASMRIGLPPEADVNAVAYVDSSTGNLLTADYDIEGNAVALSTPSDSLWIEFYDPSLEIDGLQRIYTLVMQVPYQVNDLVWEIQQPADATGFTLDVEGEQTLATDQYGLTTSVVQAGSLAAGDIVEMSFSYQKATDTLTIDQIGGTSATGDTSAAVATPPATDEGPSQLVIFALLVGGLVLVGAGVWWYLQLSSNRGKPRTRARSNKTGAAGARFCTKCGAAVEPGDRFCRNCGTKLRS
jgi:hypothetical protein